MTEQGEACIPVGVLREHGYRWEQRVDNPAYRTAACQNPRCHWQEDVQSGVTSWRQYLAHLVALAPAEGTADLLPAAVVALLREARNYVAMLTASTRNKSARDALARIDAVIAGQPTAEKRSQ